MWPRTFFRQIFSLGNAPMLALLRGISPRVAVMSGALCLVGTPTFAQDMPQNKGQGMVLTNHLLEHAPRANVQDQLEIAHALRLGLAVDRDPAEAARLGARVPPFQRLQTRPPKRIPCV